MTGKHPVHIQDMLHEALRQMADISEAGIYWIGGIAPIAAHFGFHTIWGYDASFLHTAVGNFV